MKVIGSPEPSSAGLHHSLQSNRESACRVILNEEVLRPFECSMLEETCIIVLLIIVYHINCDHGYPGSREDQSFVIYEFIDHG